MNANLYAQIQQASEVGFNKLVTVATDTKLNVTTPYVVTTDTDFMGASTEYNQQQTGIESLDELITGFGNGEMIVIGGRTGSRKTMLAIHLAINSAHSGNKTIYFNLELPIPEFNARVKSVYQLRDRSPNKKLFAINGTMDIHQIVKIIDEYAEPDAMIIIDWLGLVVKSTTTNIFEQQEKIASLLKKKASERNCKIVLLVQLKKTFNERARPDDTSIQGSDLIVQLADKVILAYDWNKSNVTKSTDLTREIAEILVVKSRQGNSRCGIALVKAKTFETVTELEQNQYFKDIGLK
jgi:replicative DNA helicase